MRTLDAVSRFLADPAVIAVLGAATIGVLATFARRRDFSWAQARERRRHARIERHSHDADGRRRPLGILR